MTIYTMLLNKIKRHKKRNFYINSYKIAKRLILYIKVLNQPLLHIK